MNQNYYKQLKKSFNTIKFLYSSKSPNEEKIRKELNEIKYIKNQVGERFPKKERELLLYCIDTLFDIIDEKNNQKVVDFVFAIKDVPDIFLGYRNLYSFNDNFDAFKEKYGEEYFKSIDKPYPRFTKKAPKNALSFFFPSSDDDFKKKHPVGYVFLVLLGLTAFLLPLIGCIIVITVFDEAIKNGAWLFLAIIGSIVFGVGLFNIVASIIHQYLGHKLTLICFLGGGALIAFSMLFCFHPQLSRFLSPESVGFYFMSLLLCAVTAIFYMLFRFAVSHWLRQSKGLGGSSQSKLKKGALIRNWLFYTEIHKKVNMGAIYYLNKAYTSLFLFNLSFILLFGLFKPLSIIICTLCVIMHILNAIMIIFERIQKNLEDHGKPIVLLAKSPNGGIDSVFVDLMFVAFALLLAYCQILMAGDLWSVDLRFF